MGAFDKCNALGHYDPHEPPFTEEELLVAMELRQVYGHPQPGRPDKCPHAILCANVADCVEKVAWYLRHREAIEGSVRDRPDAPVKASPW